MRAIYWQTSHSTKGVLWDQEKLLHKKKKRWSTKEEWQEQRGRQNTKKMAGKQQRDYWGGMSRRGDVRYTINWGDKDDQLLTPLHFNCQNKKLVQASSVSLLRGQTRKWAVTGRERKKKTCFLWDVSWGVKVSISCRACASHAKCTSEDCKTSKSKMKTHFLHITIIHFEKGTAKTQS